MDCTNKWSVVVKLLPKQNSKAFIFNYWRQKNSTCSQEGTAARTKQKCLVPFGSNLVRLLCLPLGVPGCTEGWSCPVSTWPLQESLPPASIAMWADLSRCLYRKPPCPRWSARSHTPPLKGDTNQGLRIFSQKSWPCSFCSRILQSAVVTVFPASVNKPGKLGEVWGLVLLSKGCRNDNTSQRKARAALWINQ